MTDRYAVRLFEQLFIPNPWRSNDAAVRRAAGGLAVGEAGV
jgi:hypothetical protein